MAPRKATAATKATRKTTRAAPAPRVTVINDTEVADGEIMAELAKYPVPEVAILERWWKQNETAASRGIFDRDRFRPKDKIHDLWAAAVDAVETDDVVGGYVDTTEGLAFQKVTISSNDRDEENIWNQIAADINLDARLREAWREYQTLSQVVFGVWWGTKEYKVEGRSRDTKVKRRKSYRVQVPTAITILDSFTIVPVGMMAFNRERLAWVADRDEAKQIKDVLDGKAIDPLIDYLVEGQYDPTAKDRQFLSKHGITWDALFTLRSDRVFRHTDTRPQHQRFAPVRMKGIMELLDMKNQLRQSDRATVIGATSYIVVVTKGSKDLPTTQRDLNILAQQTRQLARVPVLVGDSTLAVKIVQPNQDFTLKPERWDVLDLRIRARLYNMLAASEGGTGARADNSLILARVIGMGLESDRLMLRRSIEAEILKRCREKNPDVFTEPAKLRFHPKRISLNFDGALMSAILELRAKREISRSTVLDEVGLSQEEEAALMEMEAESYDDIFKTLATPGAAPASPGAEDPKSAGRRKGGAAPGKNQGDRFRQGRNPDVNPKDSQAASEEED